MNIVSPSFGVLGFLVAIILGLVLIAAKGAVSPWVGEIGPEAALILVVYVAWRAEKWVSVSAAFILGLCRDAAGGGFLGVYQVSLISVVWVFHPWSRRVHLEAPLPLMICVFTLALCSDLLVLTPLTALLGWPGPGFNPVPAFLVSAVLSALAAPPLFWLLGRLPGGHVTGGQHG